MKYPTVEQVSKPHHVPIGVALNTVSAGGTVQVMASSLSSYRTIPPQFKAAGDIPIGALVMFKQTRMERVKGWLMRWWR